MKAWNQYHGWQPIFFEETSIADLLSNRPSGQRVAEIESLLENIAQHGDDLQIPFSTKEEKMICEAIGKRAQVTLIVPSINLVRILDAVRNIILNWALQLEEDGVLGENMTFSDDEKDKAESHSYNVNNFYGEVTGSQIQQSSPHATQTQSLKEPSITNINNFISSLKRNADEIELGDEIAKELNAEISTIEIQNASPKPKKTILKESLGSIRTILEGATGSAAGQLLLELRNLI